ncbi:hypothetical protein [Chryseobacterium sp. SL1]|uniref:hypothetical protein n=1 Tax=Chryseobacterium sp. SL1 TaxID=2995159 RepID=UPI0022742ABD|nr:hypothetical protein [Chryseobacterium sp. SL1]MCY1660216.1 hypothetical protein [Chryseobacterium sp. SL1]
MKTYIILILFVYNFAVKAQIGIEKVSVDGDGLMDFPTGTTKGILLPQVQNVTSMANISPGTFVFDGLTAKTKYYNGISWIEMTGENGVSPTLITGVEKNVTKGLIVGMSDSQANGVLVFESDKKALILPKVINPVSNVKSPTAGMMCYDPITKLICFYNGTTWSFWGDIN